MNFTQKCLLGLVTFFVVNVILASLAVHYQLWFEVATVTFSMISFLASVVLCIARAREIFGDS